MRFIIWNFSSLGSSFIQPSSLRHEMKFSSARRDPSSATLSFSSAFVAASRLITAKTVINSIFLKISRFDFFPYLQVAPCRIIRLGRNVDAIIVSQVHP